jgi:hypothetical protein
MKDVRTTLSSTKAKRAKKNASTNFHGGAASEDYRPTRIEQKVVTFQALLIPLLAIFSGLVVGGFIIISHERTSL